MMMLHGGSGVHLRGGHEVHAFQLTHDASKTAIHFNYGGIMGKLGAVPNLGTSLCRRRIDSRSFTSFITSRFGVDAIHSKYFNSALSQLCRRAQLQRFAQRAGEEMMMLHGCTGLHLQGLGSQPHSSTGFCRRRDTLRVHCTSLKSRRETKNTKTLLSEDQMPRQWYNIIPDLPRPPPPPLHPGTLQPLQPQDLAPLFPVALIQQEATTDRYVDIPEEVLEVYKLWRPSPLFRARRLEKLLDTPARIYYKYEGVSPAGSHKPNTAIPQAWYNAQEGIKRLTTETGAGQWGCALAFACTLFDLECEVWQVRASYDQKPYRKSMMETWGATVHPSPSSVTKVGQEMLAKDPNTPGSLGIAISEAVEAALARDDTRYALGSVLNHVLLHQTIIGEECLRQLEILGETPDLLVGCTGGGSNFAGLAFPFLREKLAGKMNPVIRAVEPAACPSLTRGVYAYDFGDTSGLTPLMKMHTLGHDFIPDPIHAGGLRYHGMAPLVSHVYELGLMEAIAIPQTECFEAALKFARTEGIIPAPEPTHAIAATIREALACKESGEAKVIVTALCGHGHFDLASYDKFLAGGMVDLEYPADKVRASTSRLPNSCLH